MAAADEYAGVASAEALKLALETIYIQTTFQGYKRQAQLEKVRTLQDRFGGRWGESGSVAELFGKAYQSVRDFEGAIHWYERAVAASDGTASMVAAEQLANVRVRLVGERVVNALSKRDSMAVRLKKVAGGNRAEDRKARAAAKRALAEAEGELKESIKSARAPIKEALVLLDKLVAVQSTRERENMYGSAWKRLAMVEAAAGRPAEERKAIEAMKLRYERALVIARDSQAPDLFYPALNHLAAEVALNAGRTGWKGLDSSLLNATRASLDAKNHADPDFWSVVGQTELQLYEALAAVKLARALGSLEKGYQDLHRRVSAPWMWSSVDDTTHFVLQKYMGRVPAKEKKAAETLLANLATFAQPK